MYPTYLIEIRGRKLSVDLIELPMLEFDVILKMDRLNKNDANINYRTKSIVLKLQGEEEIIFQGYESEVPMNLISAMKT